eukprot:TRINITY_DN2283_c0_g1_i2.p1 TRINITY_DN2283_c0_g1~~TRINITY_DN2283_c0_g1_i2.p1  ORF type:complete len:262 (+),score=43.81 TRINITY_DN2283_c0_g1_i2:196-981(+)
MVDLITNNSAQTLERDNNNPNGVKIRPSTTLEGVYLFTHFGDILFGFGSRDRSSSESNRILRKIDLEDKLRVRASLVNFHSKDEPPNASSSQWSDSLHEERDEVELISNLSAEDAFLVDYSLRIDGFDHHERDQTDTDIGNLTTLSTDSSRRHSFISDSNSGDDYPFGLSSEDYFVERHDYESLDDEDLVKLNDSFGQEEFGNENLSQMLKEHIQSQKDHYYQEDTSFQSQYSRKHHSQNENETISKKSRSLDTNQTGPSL